MENKTIDALLVEDNQDEATLALRELHKNNTLENIVHLKDGVEALDFLFGTGAYTGRDLTQTPRLVLLDLKMPRVSGLEVLEKMKADQRTSNIPVVVLVAEKEAPDLQKCYTLGANSYIVKPVTLENYTKVAQELGARE